MIREEIGGASGIGTRLRSLSFAVGQNSKDIAEIKTRLATIT